MITLRGNQERGHAQNGWLDSRHSFSFGDYYDPAHLGFRALRAINEDRVQAGQGFGTHPHRDMEIVSYVLDGELEHQDSMGNGAVLRPGEFQRITAGTGITHSEFNPSHAQLTHFYQIWILPERRGIEPSYEQKAFDPTERQNRWQLVASPDAANGSLKIHQAARIYLANLEPGHALQFDIPSGQHVWLQVLRGAVDAAQYELHAGDALAISNEQQLTLQTHHHAELMLFELA
jgi:quercetin 2,3-dioxygenase